jgi:hypothetical protein
VYIPVTIMTLSFMRLYLISSQFAMLRGKRAYGSVDSGAIFRTRGIPSNSPGLGNPSTRTLLRPTWGRFGTEVMVGGFVKLLKNKKL